MAEPASLPEWDTDETNITVPTAELVDGWAVDQEPPSGFFNWWMNLVYLWIVYFRAASPFTQTISIPLKAPANATPLADATVSGADVWSVGIPIQVGKIITAIRVRMKDAGGTTFRMNLVAVTDGTPSVTSLVTSAASGATQTLSATGLSVTVAANVGYEVKFDLSAGAGLCHIYALEVDFTPS